MLTPISDLNANIERLVEVASAVADRGQQNERLLKDMAQTVKDMHQVMRGIEVALGRLETVLREQQQAQHPQQSGDAADG